MIARCPSRLNVPGEDEPCQCEELLNVAHTTHFGHSDGGKVLRRWIDAQAIGGSGDFGKPRPSRTVKGTPDSTTNAAHQALLEQFGQDAAAHVDETMLAAHAAAGAYRPGSGSTLLRGRRCIVQACTGLPKVLAKGGRFAYCDHHAPEGV